MSSNYELAIIEEALKHRDRLTEEELIGLEWTRQSFVSPLLVAARKALRCGDDEVGIALFHAFCEKYPPPVPPAAECVIYCRVSSETQTRGMGLWRQLQTCTEYAKARNYSVVAVFSEVWTGTESLHVRGQVERMAKARGCKIICEDYDRWSRRGIEDMPPANVEMASESLKELEAELREAFTPAQMHIIQGGLA